MKIDLSFKIEKEILDEMLSSLKTTNEVAERSGHVGTHLDVMDGEFSIDNIITKGKIFDISHIKTGEVKLEDLDLSSVKENDFILFHSGILKQYGYGSKEYLSTYIELSDELVNYLIEKKVSFIGVDMAGAKKPKDHPRIDSHCAKNGIFIIENLVNLDLLLKETLNKSFTVYTFPINMSGFSGLSCRVIAEV
ncbi:cyclase family protein [Clostridium chromiireducens]|uniref:Putative cyclase n=1 Tax=Clostridium chromiireducens TaxID=225345 RepID=A0A1V4J2B4_9CLOT|nr:cyclase family protein [Clostridium chromiireducens]OPJ66250.1 putative cyclase [Clostridium chromiireducens]